MDESVITYDEVITNIEKLDYNPFVDDMVVVKLLDIWHQGEIELPKDQGYIIGLNRKEYLKKEIFNCSTILYELPFIFHSIAKEKDYYRLGKTALSETKTNHINNFSGCYIIGIKK